MHVCFACIYVNTCAPMCAHVEAKAHTRCLLCHSLPYFPETESLTDLRTRLAASKP